MCCRSSACLERIDDVCPLLLECGAQLLNGQPVLVEPVAVGDAPQQLDLSTQREVLSGREQQLDVGVRVVRHAEGAVDELAHAQVVHLRGRNGQELSVPPARIDIYIDRSIYLLSLSIYLYIYI